MAPDHEGAERQDRRIAGVQDRGEHRRVEARVHRVAAEPVGASDVEIGGLYRQADAEMAAQADAAQAEQGEAERPEAE